MKQNKSAPWMAIPAFILSILLLSFPGNTRPMPLSPGENYNANTSVLVMPIDVACPPVLTLYNDKGKCTATVDLTTVPMVTDNCSPYTLDAEITGVGTGFTFNDLPKGQYEVIFTAADACDVSTCTTMLMVVDNETPSAVCVGTKLISLPSNGIAPLMATDFNGGSSDNCSQPLVFEISKNNMDFSQEINFDCQDAKLESVTVYLKVTETINLDLMNVCTTKVVVRDVVSPTIISCPPPQMIDCEADYSNLNVFGSPVVFDGCSATVTESDVFNINNCGVGTISRNFSVKDPAGNESICTQVITVVNQTPYDGSTIQWPQDYTATTGCPQPTDLEPGDLALAPVNYSKPVVTGADCAMIATSFSDQVFYLTYPACYKIVRTWKVLDWCQYTTANPNAGIWTHQQIIAVMDAQAPQIIFCPPDITVGIGDDCTGAMVNVMPVVATDCSQNLVYSNNSPYNGANASGKYPMGVHTVTFKVKDGCGNESTCATKITVADQQPPTPYCESGIVTDLQKMGGQVMASVQAKQFNKNSFDNCTPGSQLQFSIRLVGDVNPPTPSLAFDCSGEGEHKVEVWVKDAAGNSDYCTTNFIVQDNMNLCPGVLIAGEVMVAGEIKTETGENLPDVSVHLTNADMMSETDQSGIFAIGGLQEGQSYTISPKKNMGYLNGITTYDLVLMGRHVLGISPLNSPYKIIAADINRSGSVTTADIVELRKLILQVYHELPNNHSWRFVAKSHVFSNPANPFSPVFPESVNVANLSQNVLDANFIGIKIGDLNCSAAANFDDGDTYDRNGAESLIMETEDRQVQPGDEIVLPLRLKERCDLLALQFTLEFETDNLELQGIEKGVLPVTEKEVFGQSLVQDGILTAAWFNLNPVEVEADGALFSLRFKVNREGRLSEMLALTSRFTEALAYNANEISTNLNLVFANQNNMLSSAFQLYQNQPNPFKKSTSIGFTLPEPGWAKLTIYDLSGKVLKSYDRIFREGYNRLTIERDELPGGGVLFYQLETVDHTATKKMVLLQ